MSKTYPKVSAIVLAAGLSSRMGETNKLLAQVNGKSLLKHVLINLTKSDVDQIVVVAGHESEKIAQQISGPSIKLINNADFEKGLSTSIKAGIETIQSSCDAVLIMQADMPFVESNLFNQIISAFHNNDDIVIPRYKGQIGNPLLWSSKYFEQLKQLSGDKGAKQILNDYKGAISYVDVDNIGILVDIDEPNSLVYFQNRFDKE